MSAEKKGNLIIIGGHEEKHHDQDILKEVTRQVDGGNLLIVTVATEKPQEVAQQYMKVFQDLGVKNIDVMDIRSRENAQEKTNVQKVADAAVIFFTGGDQLRITSQIGDSPVFRCLQERLKEGATIAGTSAGAAAMPETMLIGGPGEESNRVSALEMAPGLALISGIVVDTHFAERGRIGRILGVVAQNPRNLGIGIDEDTAIVVQDGEFNVLGSGAVYIADGSTVTYSSLSEERAEGIVSVFDVKLHVLGKGDQFRLDDRRPVVSASIK